MYTYHLDFIINIYCTCLFLVYPPIHRLSIHHSILFVDVFQSKSYIYFKFIPWVSLHLHGELCVARHELCAGIGL